MGVQEANSLNNGLHLVWALLRVLGLKGPLSETGFPLGHEVRLIKCIRVTYLTG